MRSRLAGRLTEALATAGVEGIGVEGIGVEVDTVDRLPRDPRTGDLRPIVTEPAVR